MEVEERGGIPTPSQCHKTKSHIKNESYGEFKNARFINARPDRYLVFVGPLAKSIERVVYQLEDIFIKHTPVPERPKRIARMGWAGCHATESDYSCFEGSLLPELQKACEIQVMWHVAGAAAPDLCHLAEEVETGENIIHLFDGLEFAVEGERMSGTSFTSLFNGLENYLAFLWVCERNQMHGEGFVEGDDGLFVTEKQLFADDFALLGLTVELKELPDVCHGHFCGLTCAADGTIVKDPRRVFQTFGWTTSFLGAGNRIMDELLRSKALSLACELPQCPIVGVIARRALDITRGVVVKHHTGDWNEIPVDDESAFERALAPFRPTQAARRLVGELFGITPETQIRVELHIAEDRLDEIQKLIPPSYPVTFAVDHSVQLS